MEEVTFFHQSQINPNLLHVGGFNSTIQLYDLRKLGKPVLSSGDLGGGIWRISPFVVDNKELLGVATCSGNQFKVLSADECKLSL